MCSKKTVALGRFPMRFLTAAVILTGIVLAWSSWGAYRSYQITKLAKQRNIRIEQLRGSIIHFDEVLTMSARMAAATGDLVWEERYRHFEPQLESAINEAQQRTRALAASEMKFRTLYDSSRDAIMILTPEEGFLAGNSAAIELFGCKDEEEFTACALIDYSLELQPDGTLSAVKAQQEMAVAMEKGSHFYEWTPTSQNPSRRRPSSRFWTKSSRPCHQCRAAQTGLTRRLEEMGRRGVLSEAAPMLANLAVEVDRLRGALHDRLTRT